MWMRSNIQSFVWTPAPLDQQRIWVTPEHVTHMSVAKAAHVTVRLSQDTGRQLWRRVASRKNTTTVMPKQKHHAAIQKKPCEPLKPAVWATMAITAQPIAIWQRRAAPRGEQRALLLRYGPPWESITGRSSRGKAFRSSKKYWMSSSCTIKGCWGVSEFQTLLKASPSKNKLWGASWSNDVIVTPNFSLSLSLSWQCLSKT